MLHGAVVATAGLVGAQVPAAADVVAAGGGDRAREFGPVRVGREDPRYPHLVRRGNTRFVGTPDYVQVVGSTKQVVAAVDDAVRHDRRIAVRSGGHCFENFVDDPAVRVVVDLSGLTDVYFDRQMGAFAVEAGASLGEVYRRLYLGWGVTLPAGYCPTVGAGGHIMGGGYGPLCRVLGLASDYLHAIEIVLVDGDRRTRSVIATRDPDDPNHDLWWAHTGGGGGNFGIVTRYWLRAPEAAGRDPERLLPSPPAKVLTFTGEWPWGDMDEQAISRIVRNHGQWCERNAGADSPAARLYSELLLFRRQSGPHRLLGQVAGGADADALLTEHLDALSDEVGSRPVVTREWLPWLTAALRGNGEDGKAYRFKCKSAYLRRSLTEQHAQVIHHHLTREGAVLSGALSLNTYGGRVNTVAPHATATAHRDSIAELFYFAAWTDPAADAEHLRWLREFYRDMYAESGGVPVPGASFDGAYINYPDTDLADPAWNTSGQPWHTLYYKDNYRRLQRVKGRWDPHDIFRHALSITAP
jgi:FAD/FMN-containing dehydrogenase